MRWVGRGVVMSLMLMIGSRLLHCVLPVGCSYLNQAHPPLAFLHRVKEDGSIQMTSGVSSALTALMWQSCIQAELISPILRGQEGLVEVARVLAVLNTLPIEVNASTGLHVHVSIASVSPSRVNKNLPKQRPDVC
jgi:hypothetical protein